MTSCHSIVKMVARPAIQLYVLLLALNKQQNG
jgi:hypothetical protein